MKEIMKDCIDEIRIPDREKEEIFFRLMDQKEAKRYQRLQRKFAFVTCMLMLFLAATNWKQIYTAATDAWQNIMVYDWQNTSEEEAKQGNIKTLGDAILKSKEYTIPEGMEEMPCGTTEVYWLKGDAGNGYIKMVKNTGKYHYLQKEYVSVREAAEELGISVLTPFAGEREEQDVQLVVCGDALLKPAILTARYFAEETEKLICSLRITMYGGDLEEYGGEGRSTLGESFAETYTAKNGVEAYIYYNSYNQCSPEEYVIYDDGVSGSGAEQKLHYEYWDSVAFHMVWNKSYEALFFHDGVRYEISGGQSLEEMKEILDSFK